MRSEGKKEIMSAEFKRRNVQVLFRLTQEEHDLMRQKMASIGVVNQEAFIRKMVLDGYLLRLELPELKEMLKLLRNISNNINQIAKRTNETGRVYEADLQEIKENQDRIWEQANRILHKLAEL